MQQKE